MVGNQRLDHGLHRRTVDLDPFRKILGRFAGSTHARKFPG